LKLKIVRGEIYEGINAYRVIVRKISIC